MHSLGWASNSSPSKAEIESRDTPCFILPVVVMDSELTQQYPKLRNFASMMRHCASMMRDCASSNDGRRLMVAAVDVVTKPRGGTMRPLANDAKTAK
jgi:hypothetical protein